MRRRITVSKIAVGLLVGFLARFCFELLYARVSLKNIGSKRCSPCEDPSKIRGEPCPFCGSKSVIGNAGGREINNPYKPKGMYEITRWLYFDEENLYDIIDGEPVVKLVGGALEETRAVTQVALEYVNANQMLGKRWELLKLQNGYMRTDVLRGTDYILDLKVKSKEKYESESVQTTLRVRMVHPFEPKKQSISLVSHRKIQDQQIHIIAIVSGDEQRLERFVKKYTELRAQKDKLTLMLFDGKTEFGEESITLEPHLNELIRRYPSSEIQSIKISGDYDFLRALHEAVKHNSDEIILTLTLDMHYGTDLLERCRLVAVPNKRVYFPTAFSQYDPEMIERGMPAGKPKNVNKMDITKFTGYWMHGTYDYICAHHNDLSQAVDKLVLSGARTTKDSTTFTKTDAGISLFDMFLSDGFEVVSCVEPDLRRLFRKIHCNVRYMSDEAYRHCFKTAAEMLGSKPAMSMIYLTEIAMRKL